MQRGGSLPITLDVQFVAARGTGAELGESPFWDFSDSIWWVDVAGCRLLRTRLSRRETAAWPTPQTPGFVALAGPDVPIVGMQRGIYAFAPGEGAFRLLVAFDRVGQRFNDATVDATGRLWVTTMAMDAAPGKAALHEVTGDLTLRTVVDGLTIPNGLASGAGGRLFLSDSHPESRTIWSMDCSLATGAVAGQAKFVTMRETEGRPDGAAMSTNGDIYWIAGVDGGALHGYDGAGVHRYRVPLPFPAPTKLAFFPGGVAVTTKAEGGHDGRLVLAFDPPAPLSGPAVPFWRPPGPASALQ